MNTIIHIQCDTTNTKQVFKVGGLNKAKRIIKTEQDKERQFIALANKIDFKTNRATKQRNDRRAKRK